MKKWLIAIFAIVVIALTPMIVNNVKTAVNDVKDYVTSQQQQQDNTNTDTETETEQA